MTLQALKSRSRCRFQDPNLEDILSPGYELLADSPAPLSGTLSQALEARAGLPDLETQTAGLSCEYQERLDVFKTQGTSCTQRLECSSFLGSIL